MFGQLGRYYRESGMMAKIILINAAIFLLINIPLVASNLFGAPRLDMPGSTTPIAVYWLSVPSFLKLFIIRPWTWFTYMFVHLDVFHILSNILVLYFVGRIFCDLLSDRRFLPTYIFGGLAGAFLYVLLYNIAPNLYGQNSILYGASASVMAVFLATATYFPDYEVYLFGVFRVKLKWLALVYVVLDFVALKGQDNIGGHIAHLGGALYGFIYARQLSKGNDWSEFFYKLTASIGSIFTPGRKVKVVHRAMTSNSSAGKPSKSEKQQIIDTILDKISRSGYESLSKEEKEILLKAGED